MPMYAKVFEQIFDSSISEDHVVRHVFMDLLVLADKHGEVDMTLSAISRRTNVPLEVVRHAVSVLCSPDESSRTQDFDGRRLCLLDEHRDWGWQIVNYAHYNAMRNEDARREYFREYKAGARRKQRESVHNVHTVSTPVHHESTVSTHVSVPVDTPVHTKKVQKPSRGKRESDPRHTPFREACQKYAAHMGAVFLWGPAEAKQLDLLLAAAPDLTIQDFRQCLNNRARSPAVVHSERPRVWLPNILRFQQGPVNQFNQPEGTGNGERKSKSEQTIDAGRAFLEEEAHRLGLGPTRHSPSGSETIEGGLRRLRGGPPALPD